MFLTSPAGHVSVAAFPGATLGVSEGPGCPGQPGSEQPRWVASGCGLLFADGAYRAAEGSPTHLGPQSTAGKRDLREQGHRTVLLRAVHLISNTRFQF